MDEEEADQLLVEEYSRLAQAYEAYAAPTNMPLVRSILKLACVRRGEDVLDLGCGPGNLAFEAARRVGGHGSVRGVDPAAGMIRIAQGLAIHRGARTIRFEVADARDLPYPDSSFDVVASCLGIPTVGLRRCFQEAHRLLRPRGRFVFCVGAGTGPGREVGQAFRETLESFGPRPPPEDVRRLLEAREVLRTVGGPNPARDHVEVLVELHDIGFRTARCTVKMHRSAFRSVDAYIQYSLAWGDNERQWRAMGPSMQEALRRDFGVKVRPFVRRGRLVYPREVRYYTAENR